MNLGGSLMRQMERTMPLDPQSPHVINIGKLVEEHENKIRNTLNDIYFGKSRDIVNGLRYLIKASTVVVVNPGASGCINFDAKPFQLIFSPTS